MDGVGDAALGEWFQDGVAVRSVVHLRRRLSVSECIEYGLSMRDLRGTPEGNRRIRGVLQRRPELRRLAISIGEFQP